MRLIDDLIISVCEHLTIYEIQDKLFDCGNVRLRQLIQDKNNTNWLLDHHVITRPHGRSRDGILYYEGYTCLSADIPTFIEPLYKTHEFCIKYRNEANSMIPKQIVENENQVSLFWSNGQRARYKTDVIKNVIDVVIVTIGYGQECFFKFKSDVDF